MNGKVIFSVLFTGIAAMMVLSIVPAMATTAIGEITWINQADKHGKITLGDDPNTVFQFNIPNDLQEGYTPIKGQTVNFWIDPENSRHAINVGPGNPVPEDECPPDCGGGTGV